LLHPSLNRDVKSEPCTSNIIVGVDKKDEDITMPLMNSQLDLKVKSKPFTHNITSAVDLNDDESQTASDQNDPIGSDSDSNLSTYTNANTYVEDSFMYMYRKRSNEPIRTGWMPHICFPSLFTCTRLQDLPCMTIVNGVMELDTSQPMSIVTIL
jgi:hypothetical protein